MDTREVCGTLKDLSCAWNQVKAVVIPDSFPQVIIVENKLSDEAIAELERTIDQWRTEPCRIVVSERG